MPQLIRIQPQEGVPGQVPYGQASPATFGAVEGAVLQGVQDVSREVQEATQDYARVYHALGKEDRRLNLVETLSALKDEYAARDVETRGKLGTSVDPATGQTQGLDPIHYLPTMQGVQAQLLQKYEKGLKYPDTAAAFRAQALPFLTTEGIKARYQGLNLQNELMKVRDAGIIERASNEAVTAPTQKLRDAAVQTILDRVRTGVESTRYSGTEGAAMLSAAQRTISRGSAIRDFEDPDKRLNVTMNLMTGTYSPHLSFEEQRTLARTMQTQWETDQNKVTAKAEKDAKVVREETETTLLIRAQRKDITSEEIYSTALRVGLNREAVAAITHELAKPAIEAPSDPGTRDRVSADVMSYNPKIAESEIKRLHMAGLLNTTDRNAFLEKLTSRMTHLLERGDSLSVQQQGMAERWARAELGIPDFLPPGVDPKREQAWAGVMREFSKRSNAFRDGGTETPMAVARDIIPVYKQLLDGNDKLDFARTDTVARFKTMGDLQAARPTMSKAQYEAERERTQALLDLIKQNLQRSIEQGIKAGEGGAPTTKKSKKSTDLPAVK